MRPVVYEFVPSEIVREYVPPVASTTIRCCALTASTRLPCCGEPLTRSVTTACGMSPATVSRPYIVISVAAIGDTLTVSLPAPRSIDVWPEMLLTLTMSLPAPVSRLTFAPGGVLSIVKMFAPEPRVICRSSMPVNVMPPGSSSALVPLPIVLSPTMPMPLFLMMPRPAGSTPFARQALFRCVRAGRHHVHRHRGPADHPRL